jgi:hypothetical protein
MKMNIIITGIMAIMASVPASWQLEKEEDGIKVYLAEAENTSFKQFKVEAYIDASPLAIANAVTDLDNNYKWFSGVQKATRIKQVNTNEFLFKQVIEVPFPFKNRETVQYCTVVVNADKSVHITLVDRNNAAPLDSRYVRMPMAKGYWIITPKGTGSHIEYSFISDPGGNIPAWLANEFIVDSPFKTIKGLRQYLKNK